MSRKASAVAAARAESQTEPSGAAHKVGWYLFLAFVALTPLVLTVVPPQSGALVTLQGLDSVELPKAVLILVLSGLSLAALCVGVVRREIELHWHPVLWILLGIFGWAAVSTVFSASPAQSIIGNHSSDDGLVAILGYAVVAFLAIQYVRSTRALRTVMVIAAISGTLVSIYAILQYFGIDPLPYTDPTIRVFATMGNPDMLGTYLVFPLALSAGLALSTPRGWRAYAWWAVAVVIALALVATETRGAWIGALVAAVCIGLVGWGGTWEASRRSKLLIGGLALAAVALSAIAIVMIRPKHAGSASTLASILVRLSNGRTVIWLTGLRAWLSHPITGWGPDGFGRAFLAAVGPDWYAIIQGLQKADNAHNFLVQVLVTLGIPGLVLTVWALVQTAVQSLRGIPSARGASRTLLVVLWGALAGLVVALFFGVTLPGVSVWLWLTVGLLLAPISPRISAPGRAIPIAAAAVGVAVALWAGSWLVADFIAADAAKQPVGPAQIAGFETAVRINPLSADYHWLVGEAIANQAFAMERSGQDPQAADAALQRAIAAYQAAARSNPGDAMVRVALANILISYASTHPGSGAADQAIQVARESVRLSPENPAALVALARAYQVAGRQSDALSTARLAREVAPAYSMQTLGSLGLETTTTP